MPRFLHFDFISNILSKIGRSILRFIWGRERLPLAWGDLKFRIGHIGAPDDPDRGLPQSHTCFFHLLLPRYSCAAVAKRQLLWAADNCGAIDADGYYAGLSEAIDTGSDHGGEVLSGGASSSSRRYL